MNPGLGAVVVAGYLMIGSLAIADVTTSDWAAVAQVRLAAPLPSSPTLNKERNVTPILPSPRVDRPGQR
jgi:hypothetical protein